MQETLIRDLMRVAYKVADDYSPDTSTKVGALVIVGNKADEGGGSVVQGWNHYTPGFGNKPEDFERPRKYKLIEHAERHAVYTAAKHGYCTTGGIMVCPWAACTDCARAIILSGLKKIIAHGNALEKTPERWREELELAKTMFHDAGVEYEWWYGQVGDCRNLFDGQYWSP